MGVFGFPDPYTNTEEFGKIIKEATDNGLIIAEIKKIKTEIAEIGCFRNNPYNDKTEYSVSMKELRELFDKHISELEDK